MSKAYIYFKADIFYPMGKYERQDESFPTTLPRPATPWDWYKRVICKWISMGIRLREAFFNSTFFHLSRLSSFYFRVVT